MAASITFDFVSRGGPELARQFKSTGDNAAAAARGAKVLQTVISDLGTKENRTAAESQLLAKALRQTGDAEDRAAAKALAADIAIRRLDDAMQDASKSAGNARGGFAGLVGEITGFGAAGTAASSKSSMFAKALAGINLASGVLEPALAGVAVAAGGIGAAFAAAGAGAVAYSAALKPLLSQTQDVMKAQETLDKARATAEANYAAAIKSGASAKTADAARTKAMTAAQDQYNIAVKGTPGPVREFAKSVTAAQNSYKSWADSLARPVLDPLSTALKLVKPALTALTPLVKVAAGAFGTLVTELSGKVSAGGLTTVVSTLLPHVRDTILDLGHAAGNVAAGIWGILKAFLPVSGQITGGVVKLTAKFREWGQSLSGGTGFQSLMTTFREETPQAVAILKNLGVVLGNVGKAMFGLSSFSNSKTLLNMLLPLSGVMASLSKNTDLVRIALYALLAVKIGQQFTWIGDAAKALVVFSGAAKGATVAQVIAAAATRAWGIAMMALPWVALAAAVVAVAVLIIKYHTQIWNFMKRAWHDILAVIMAAWNWVKTHWPLLVAIITGPIGIAALAVIKNWKAITDAARSAWNTIAAGFRWLVDKILGVFSGIIHGAAAAFGWVPGLGGKLRGAAAAFDRFRASVNKSLGGINNKTVSVSVAMTSKTNPYAGGISGRAASGMFVSQGAGPTADDQLILASRGELVVPTRLVRAGAVDHLRGQIPGFASGGVVVSAHTPSAKSVESTLMGSVMKLAQAFAKSAQAAAAAGSSVPGGGGGAARWKNQILTALAMLGQPASLLGAVEHRMNQESGGNPRAVNLWDSNAAAGYPSTGVMQVIRPTYQSYSAPGWRNLPPMAYGVSEDVLANTYAGLHYAVNAYRGRSLASVMMQPGGYAKGGLVPGYAKGGLIGYASGGTVAKQGRAWLNAWRSRHGGGFGAAWGPKVLNQQIPAMAAAMHRAQALAGAGGLSPGQHRFWAKTAADEKKRLGVLGKELATERAWRYQLQLNELGLDRQVHAAGNLPGLRGAVRGWKAQMGRDRATIAGISKMLGYSDAYLKAHKPAPKVTPPGVPGSIPHTGAYTDSTADLIAQLFAASAALTRTVTLDSGGTLAPGWNAAYNGTGRPEQLIPAGRGGGAGTIVLQNHGVIGSQAQLEDWLVRSYDNLKRKRRI